MPSLARGSPALKSRYRWMNHDIRFQAEDKKECDALCATIPTQFKEKLAERFENPLVRSAKIHGSTNQ